MRTYSNPFGQAIDQFLNQSLSDVFGVDVVSGRPSVNIREESDKHILELAVPGVPKEDIAINIEQGKLVISADHKMQETTENKSESEEPIAQDRNNKKYTRREFNYDAFKRSFHLPNTADRNTISAKYTDGILRIEIAKKEEAVDNGPINIEVK